MGGLEGNNLVIVEQLIHFVEDRTCVGLYLKVAHPSPAQHGSNVFTHIQYIHEMYSAFCDYTLCDCTTFMMLYHVHSCSRHTTA